MKYILSIILSLTILEILGQCTLNDLFPFEFFSSKFDTEINLQRSNNFKINNTQKNSQWFKPDYLNGDSVYITRIEAILNTSCINSNEIEVSLVFSDDKLYGIFLEATYDLEDVDKCLNDYKNIAIETINIYPNFLEVNVKDENQQKIGEAYKYYRNNEEQLKNEYSTGRIQFKKVNNKYILKVSHKNFDKTKIDNRGFLD